MSNVISRGAGPACLAGGAGWFLLAMLGAGDDLHPTAGYLLFVLVLACLACGPLALLARRAAGSGGARWVGVAGAALTLLGQLSYAAGSIYAVAEPEDGLVHALGALGALLVGVGMLALGSAVLAARRLTGWRSAAPLLVGLYYAAMIPIQIVYFIVPEGRPSETLLAFWGLAWAALGCALIADHGRRGERHA